MKCCRRYVSQTFAINTFRFAIFSSKKPFPTRVFIHRRFFKHFVNIFVKKLLIFLIFQNKNTKMLTDFITKTFYYMKYSSFPCRLHAQKWTTWSMLSTTCCNVVLNNLLQCCAAPYQQLLSTSIVHGCWNNYCLRLTNQQGVNVVETAQNNVITVLLNAWQINKAWTTLLEQLRSTWYHSSFILSTTANIIVSTMLIRLPV